MNIEITIITAQDAYPVRHSELRKGKPIESCAFEGDLLEQTLHIGAFIDQKIVGVASFMYKPVELGTVPNKKESYEMQLRGMAVLQAYHQKGIGANVLKFGEETLKKRNFSGIWMNARIKAIGFYEKLGYYLHGSEFLIEGVGIHYKMSKKI